jgi:type IV pilus assembly protein PilX
MTMPRLALVSSSGRQRGAVLVLCLLVLLMLTLLALAATRSASLQERIAGNARSLDLAFQAAEAALREGERRLEGTVPAPGTVPGWYHHEINPAPRWEQPAVWDSQPSLTYTLNSDDGWQVAREPQFAIEELGPIPDPEGALEAGGELPPATMYRISARGFGATVETQVILQTTFRR